jgi:hypothetical protein
LPRGWVVHANGGCCLYRKEHSVDLSLEGTELY